MSGGHVDTYNGLHQRTSKTAYPLSGTQSTGLGGKTLTVGEKRWFTYNSAWQAIAEEIDTDFGSTSNPSADGMDRHIQQDLGQVALTSRATDLWLCKGQCFSGSTQSGPSDVIEVKAGPKRERTYDRRTLH